MDPNILITDPDQGILCGSGEKKMTPPEIIFWANVYLSLILCHKSSKVHIRSWIHHILRIIYTRVKTKKKFAKFFKTLNFLSFLQKFCRNGEEKLQNTIWNIFIKLCSPLCLLSFSFAL